MEHKYYKIGDKVQVVRKIIPEGFVWTSPMDNYVGRVGRIIDKHPQGVKLCFGEDDSRKWWFPFLSLSPAINEKVNKTFLSL